MDRLFWAVTAVCVAVLLLPAFGGRIDMAAGIALILTLMAGWFRPIAYEVDSEGLRIIYPMRWRRIVRQKIVKAWRLDYRTLSPMIRVGVGGFLGIFGMFYRPGKGWVDVSVTSARDLVLLERQDSCPLLLSPQDPAAFLRSLGMTPEPGPYV
jgi:hypothetical protein